MNGPYTSVPLFSFTNGPSAHTTLCSAKIRNLGRLEGSIVFLPAWMIPTLFHLFYSCTNGPCTIIPISLLMYQQSPHYYSHLSIPVQMNHTSQRYGANDRKTTKSTAHQARNLSRLQGLLVSSSMNDPCTFLPVFFFSLYVHLAPTFLFPRDINRSEIFARCKYLLVFLLLE